MGAVVATDALLQQVPAVILSFSLFVNYWNNLKMF